MAILDFEEFPANHGERLSLLRFRLKKTVPFHIDEAQLSYSIQRDQPGHIEVLAVTVARPILVEYETLFVEAGLRVGMVVPSLLAALTFCGQSHQGIRCSLKPPKPPCPWASSKRAVSAWCGALILALRNWRGTARSNSPVFPILRQTLAFAEDQLGQPVNRAMLCGFGPETNTLGERIEEEFGIPFTFVKSRFGPALAEKTPACWAFWSNTPHDFHHPQHN